VQILTNKNETSSTSASRARQQAAAAKRIAKQQVSEPDVEVPFLYDLERQVEDCPFPLIDLSQRQAKRARLQDLVDRESDAVLGRPNLSLWLSRLQRSLCGPPEHDGDADDEEDDDDMEDVEEEEGLGADRSGGWDDDDHQHPTDYAAAAAVYGLSSASGRSPLLSRSSQGSSSSSDFSGFVDLPYHPCAAVALSSLAAAAPAAAAAAAATTAATRTDATVPAVFTTVPPAPHVAAVAAAVASVSYASHPLPPPRARSESVAETDSEDAFSPELAAMEATSSPPPLMLPPVKVFSPFVGLDIKDIRGIGVKPACPAVGNLRQPMPRSPTPTPDPTATGGVNGDGTQADGTGADGRGRGWAAMQPV